LCTNYVKTKKCAEEKHKKNEELKVIDVWKWNNEEEWFEARKHIKLKKRKWDEKRMQDVKKNGIESTRRGEMK
jgi:hypothetical protein